MLIPQFSLRWMLAVMTGLAVVFLIVSRAAQGNAWAVGVSAGVLMLAVVAAVHGGLFFLIWLVSLLAQRRTKVKAAALSASTPFKQPGGSEQPGCILLLLAVLAHAAILAPDALHAATGGMTSLPLPQPRPAPGTKPKPPNPRAMKITIDTTWAECNGYRPVRFTITPTPPLTADRTLTLRFEPRSWTSGQPRIAMTQDVEVPAGAASVKAVMAVPQFEAWNTYSFDVFDDGVPVEELSVPMHRITINTNNTFFGDVSSPTMLLLGAPKRADVLFSAFSRTMESAIPLGIPPTIVTAGGGTTVTPGLGKFTGLSGISSPADLPTRWIDYSGLDIVYVELHELQQFVAEFPQQWQAIRQWLTTGGNLWVGIGLKSPNLAGKVVAYVPNKSITIQIAPGDSPPRTTQLNIVQQQLEFQGIDDAKQIVGMSVSIWTDEFNAKQAVKIAKGILDTTPHQPWQRLAALEKLLELPAIKNDESETPGWTAPDEKRRFEMLDGLGRSYAQPNPAAASTVSAVPTMPSTNSEQPLFRMRSLGQGQVMVFEHDDPLNDINQPQSWNWIFNSAGAERWSWYRRHGVSLQRENPDFWEFLIPGVGLAPVTEFQVLITLFVLTIGPLNFFLLRRWRKLNLIVVTVPLGALAVTGALLVYALVADGLGVRVRGRSLTEIDQKRGETVCWSRLSYYAGLRPSQGLAFPTDTTVYPIEHEASGTNYGNKGQRRVIDWRQKQYLGSGWLNARTPTQLLTVSARPMKHKLQILETGAAPPVVENLLGTGIHELMLIDSQGRSFNGQQIAPAAKVSLQPSTSKQNAERFAKAIDRNRPQRPPGMSGQTYGLFGVRRRYGAIYYNQNDMEGAAQRTSVLERRLQGLNDENNPRPTAPRTYVAIVERSPEMTFGLESVNEEAGFHVIVGKW